MILFNEQQIKQLKSRGISINSAEKQLALYQRGIQPVLLYKPSTRENGIEIFTEEEVDSYIKIWKEEIDKISAIKFVPASGVASRMFKTLFEVRVELLNSPDNQKKVLKEWPLAKQFFNDLEKYPFFHDLERECQNKENSLNILIKEKNYIGILDCLLFSPGLNYGNLPKGLLKFHRYTDNSRTAFEEHLVETSGFIKNSEGRVNLHFTVSPEHLHLFKKLAELLISNYKRSDIADFAISFSEQDPATDTLAVDMDNMPFLTGDGNLLFRPGGHGALLKNLESLEQSVVFIGNIDNISPDRLKPLRVRYKQLLGGLLLERVNLIHSFLRRLDFGLTYELKNEITAFIRKYVSYETAEKFSLEKESRFIVACQKLFNRPIRVCGMVINTGEPGGGPFWIKNSRGEISKQIIESSQVDMKNEKQKVIFNSSTHFNSVDLACFIKDYKGNKFKLQKYVDSDMAFIALKSQEGRELKTLELPGLWNGAMAGWLTFFVEVPPGTFSPVKTIFDLMRPEHL